MARRRLNLTDNDTAAAGAQRHTGSMGMTAGGQRSVNELNRKYPIRGTSLPCSGELQNDSSLLLADVPSALK